MMQRANAPSIRGLLGLLLLFGALAAPARAQPPAPHTVLGADLEPLLSDFNDHSDKLRAILLVAPT